MGRYRVNDVTKMAAKMAAMAPIWPPPPRGTTTTSRDDPVTRSGVCHALDHRRNGFGPEC